jgi:exo-1,4-beta-D-glucosaminidase
MVANRTPDPAGPFTVDITVRNVDGSVRSHDRRDVPEVTAATAFTAGKIEIPDDVSPAYFVELLLSAADGEQLSRNVYWLSTTPDVVDWEKTFWQHTPQSRYADFSALQDLPVATIEARIEASSDLGQGTMRVTLRNTSPSATPVIGLHASVVTGSPASPIAPIRWDDNDVTLFGGQSITLTARYSAAGLTSVPYVQLDAFNLKEPIAVIQQVSG